MENPSPAICMKVSFDAWSDCITMAVPDMPSQPKRPTSIRRSFLLTATVEPTPVFGK